MSAIGARIALAAPAPEIAVVTLQPRSVTLSTDLPGRVSAFEISEVRPLVSGIIRQRFFTEGKRVTAGQLLYQIDDAPYRAALASAEGQLARAKAIVEASALQAKRYGELAKINAVSRQETDNARASARQAQADVLIQRAAIDAAKINMGYTRIRAPISGRIGRSLITTGALVQNGQTQPLATIQSLDPVYVDLTQPASALLTLRTEMAGGRIDGSNPDSARVRLVLPNGADYPQEGHLEFADVTVNQDTGSVVLRSVFPNPHSLLLPGMFIRARIIEGIMKDALLVPASGVGRDEAGRATAFIIDAQNRVASRKIEVSRLIGPDWLVTAGLAAGERVAVQGTDRIAPGMVVQPKPVDMSGAPPSGPMAGASSGAAPSQPNSTIKGHAQ